MFARRHLHWIIALLLPLMVVRGLLPAGYMPVVERGEIRMALCSDGLQLSTDTQHSGKHRVPGSGGDCPFAHTAASAPLPAALELPPVSSIGGSPSDTRSAQQPARVIPRAQRPRGPPDLH